MPKLRGIGVGAGYFARFHYEAWQRMDQVELVAVCDTDDAKAASVAEEFGINYHGDDLQSLVDKHQPDFVDVITPPATHLGLVRELSARGIHILCQKPLAPSIDEARQLVRAAQDHGVRLMVHENFRFQPWHREIKRLLGQGAVGDSLHSLSCCMRMGDGWGEDAYLGRQPYFRTMPRLLVYETGVHFIDTFRFLAGEIDGVYATLRRLNPVIAGEDAGIVLFEFASGATGIWDANRFNECNDPDPRYTFGEFLIEGNQGSIRLHLDGRLMIQSLGQPEHEHAYHHRRHGFGGDCVFATLEHFSSSLESNNPFETDGSDYLRTLAVQEAVYMSAEEKRRVEPDYERAK